jgi:hypothetical protein
MKIDNDILIQNKIYEHSKLVLLADELNFDQTFGVTKSILKIRRNLHVIGFDLNNEFEKELANANHELICIWQLGRYISVINVKKDKKQGVMLFFEFIKGNYAFRQFALQMLASLFCDKVSMAFERHYEEMSSGFSADDDIVELSVDAYDLN